jgi:serine/threonine-protein kinase RsbW
MGGCESSKTIALSFATEARLRDVLEIALAACSTLPIPAQNIARVAIIVEELLANIYDHGCMRPGGVVALRLIAEAAAVRLILEDPGQSFDPRDAPADAPVPERGGGAGINLMRSWAKIIAYDARPDVNRLELLIPVV